MNKEVGYKFEFCVEGKDLQRAIDVIRKTGYSGVIQVVRIVNYRGGDLTSLEGILEVDEETGARKTFDRMGSLLRDAKVYAFESGVSWRKVEYYR